MLKRNKIQEMIKKSKTNFINVKIETRVSPGLNKSTIRASGKFLGTSQVRESKVNPRILIKSKDLNAFADRND
ncbi:hypothetical protein AR546_04675 [Leptospira interrogans serovar Canicola]|nr:hypothetical protein B2G47_15430 [Leptospira interrogans serovar Canicola]EKO69670.1 hypothetical protein LEP1GSC069_4190 [Leptospira interrogans serovar Canicola str. Fiocruz LV133]EMK17072.1 hypothetical protein LEP1GSC075_2543 [Leptospira interrogans str. Kito]EMN78122.1 hypothetical protein LEP1GSC102_0771 [Leptospira interrogans str. UI 09600]OQM32025.1 hypothetical protein DV30_06755 [Leptospira interrogans serovar Canicola str. Gui44]